MPEPAAEEGLADPEAAVELDEQLRCRECM